MAKRDTEAQIVGMAKDIEYIKKYVEDINKKLSDDFVTKTEFDPVKKIVYGLITLILVAVIGAVLSLIFIR